VVYTCRTEVKDGLEEFLYVFPTKDRGAAELLNAQNLSRHGTMHINDAEKQNG
jgi:hypothetical protein